MLAEILANEAHEVLFMVLSQARARDRLHRRGDYRPMRLCALVFVLLYSAGRFPKG